MKIGLHVMQTPRKELAGQAVIFAESNLLHESAVNHVFIVDGIPDVVLLCLHRTQHSKRINVLVRLECCDLSSRIVTKVYHRCLIRMLNRLELRFYPFFNLSSSVFGVTLVAEGTHDLLR